MVAVPAEAICQAFDEFLKEAWGLDRDDALTMAQRPLKEKAAEVRDQILHSAIKDHPLYAIVSGILNDVVDHSEAIDRLGKSKVALLNVRHIEEVYTVAKYLCLDKDRHQEFEWRWKSFATLHAIRNRVLNLRQPVDSSMSDFLKANIDRMKQYFSKKFDLDESKCLDQWEKLSNWMMNISIKEVFEKAGRRDSYVSAAYDWNSQAVHLSPLGDYYLGFNVEHMDFGDFALEAANTRVLKLCHECAYLVEDQSKLRDYYFKQVMIETYGMLVAKPARYIELSSNGGRYAALTNGILQKPFDVDHIKQSAVSEPPADPYILNFPT